MFTKLGLYAILFESAAWASMLLEATSDRALAGYLLAHAAASGALALLATSMLPPHLRKPRWPILLLVFGAAYALPIIGFVATIAGIFLLRALPVFRARERFEPTELPKIDPQQRAGAGFRQSGLSSFLSNPAVPEASRLRALVALQAVPGRVAAPLLRNVLTDQSEDIRLLAYGMLDNQEKRLNDEIHLERMRLEGAAEGGAVRLESVRRLADLYWELIYQELVQGDLYRHALAESLRHTEAALAGNADDAAMQMRLGRLLHLSGRSEEAGTAYDRALALGLPASRITPYRAELAFARRDYASVRTLMSSMAHWRAMPRLRPVVDYWAAPPDEAAAP